MASGRRRVVEVLSTPYTPYRSSLLHALAIFWYQLKIFLTYRSWVSVETLSVVASIAIYYFLSFQIEPQRFSTFGYGDDYFAFALIGVAFANYLHISITRLGHSLNLEIHTGTFETVVSSPLKLRSYVVAHSARGFIIASYYMLGALAVGVVALGAELHFEAPALASTLVILLLMVLSHLGIGIAAAGVILVHKQGDPLTYIFSLVMYFVSGVLFPLRLLDAYPPLNLVAQLMPYTYALDALRKTLILGATLTSPAVLYDFIVLVGFSAAALPLGLAAFRWGYWRARMDGTTSTY